MNKPKRVQRKRTKGWKMPPNTVYVGRPTQYGNPCKVGDWSIGFTERQTAEAAVNIFRTQATILHNRLAMEALRGKNLACWCPLVDKDGNPVPCHADVLLEIAMVESWMLEAARQIYEDQHV